MHTTASVTIPMQMRPKSLSQIIVLYRFFLFLDTFPLFTYNTSKTLEVYLFRENAEDLTR